MAAIFNAMTNRPPPAYADIYRYINNPGGVQNPLTTANTSEMSDADYYASLLQQTPGLQYAGSGDQGPQFSLTPGGFLDKLSQQGQVKFSNGRDLQFSGLPKTRFGDVMNTMPVRSDTKLLNPNLVYDDPNYGRITLGKNLDTGRNGLVGPLLMAIASMGAGSLISGAAGASAASAWNTANSGMRLAQGIFKGGNPLAAIASAGLGYAGVPANIRPFINMAISQMLKNKGKP